jgi:hypothetical protein
MSDRISSPDRILHHNTTWIIGGAAILHFLVSVMPAAVSQAPDIHSWVDVLVALLAVLYKAFEWRTGRYKSSDPPAAK